MVNEQFLVEHRKDIKNLSFRAAHNTNVPKWFLNSNGEDYLSEMNLRVLMYYDEGRGKLGTFCTVAGRNLIVQMFRRYLRSGVLREDAPLDESLVTAEQEKEAWHAATEEVDINVEAQWTMRFIRANCTEREVQVAEAYLDGCTLKTEIAERLGISPERVRQLVEQIKGRYAIYEAAGAMSAAMGGL